MIPEILEKIWMDTQQQKEAAIKKALASHGFDPEDISVWQRITSISYHVPECNYYYIDYGEEGELFLCSIKMPEYERPFMNVSFVDPGKIKEWTPIGRLVKNDSKTPDIEPLPFEQ